MKKPWLLLAVVFVFKPCMQTDLMQTLRWMRLFGTTIS